MAGREKVLEMLNWYEYPFAKMGLNTPAKRFVFGGVGTTAVLWIAKPSALFEENGQPRAWIFTSTADNFKEAVYFPWWAYSLGVAILFSVFI